MWKEEVVTLFKILFWHMLGETETGGLKRFIILRLIVNYNRPQGIIPKY
jgi:hypothetical protein